MICKTLLKSVSKPLQIYSNGFLVHSVRTVITSPSTDFSHQTIPREVEEIKIPVPWGHLAAKWWGPKNKRPILMAHGWQDNCGTFNTLVPHLRSDIGYLAFDFPGHGLSSHFPLGANFLSGVDNFIILRRIVKYFNWDSLSIIGHSLGGISGFCYAGMLPEEIDLFISIDGLKFLTMPADASMSLLPGEIEKYLKSEEQIMSSKKPSSGARGELLRRLHLGSNESIAEDKCHHILDRNISPSAKDESKFYFSTDLRQKSKVIVPLSNDYNIELAMRAKCPILAIKALDGFLEKEYFYDVVDILKERNPFFKYVEVDGTHHVHLNEPEKIVNPINEYLDKYSQHLAN